MYACKFNVYENCTYIFIGSSSGGRKFSVLLQHNSFVKFAILSDSVHSLLLQSDAMCGLNWNHAFTTKSSIVIDTNIHIECRIVERKKNSSININQQTH